MYTAIVFLALVALGAAVSVQDVVLDEWQEFKLTFDKTYEDIVEEQLRYNIFKENKVHIATHNMRYALGEESYQLGLNHLSDMLPDEILAGKTGLHSNIPQYLNFEKNIMEEDEYRLWNVELPKHVDWRQKGAVTPIKAQKHCNSDWAFAAIGALESHHFIKTGKLVLLSEQNLLDCNSLNHGCQGGMVSKALEYIQKNHGVDTQQSYPYVAEQQKCNFRKASVGANVTGIVVLPHGDELQLMKAVAHLGPVTAVIDADRDFHFYKDGIYESPTCKKDRPNHVILIIGYGTDRGNDYWLVKNSWGGQWGIGGYAKIARNKNMCGIAQTAIYPMV